VGDETTEATLGFGSQCYIKWLAWVTTHPLKIFPSPGWKRHLYPTTDETAVDTAQIMFLNNILEISIVLL
jgi:hypothetical protein